MRALLRSVVVKSELSWKEKVSVYCSIFVPTLTYGLSLRDRGRSSTIQRELGVEPLLLNIERSQLRWFIWFGCLLVASLWKFFRHVQLGGGPRADPEFSKGIIYPI